MTRVNTTTNLLVNGTLFSNFSLRRIGSVVVALGVFAPALAQAPSTIGSVIGGAAPMHVPNRVLVKARPGLPSAALDQLMRETGGGRRAGFIAGADVHIIELPPNANARAVAARLAHNPHLKFAELDQVVPRAALTNDPSLPSEWHQPQIGAPAAWDRSAGQGVTIAILDTGVDAAHPDLAAAIVPGWNVYDNNSDTRDVQGHGTLAAGVAAAIGNNGQGVAGVAWGARIMPIRIADANAWASWSAMAQGITYAADHGARVVNLSYQNSCGSAAVQSAAQYLRNRGGVVVISAGNTSGPIPDAASDLVTCVSATDQGDALTSWSSYGPAVDLAAPGAGILTTSNGGGYAGVSGTSFSAPIVAGTYALMMAANWNLAPATLDSIIRATARDLGAAGFDERFGYGRVDAAAAVARAAATVTSDTTPPTVAIANPANASRVRGVLLVDATASDASGVERVDLLVNGVMIASDPASPYGFAVDTSKYADGTQLTLVANAFDRAGNIGTSSASVVTVANDITPPSVSIANPANGAMVSGTVNIAVSASDNNAVTRTTLTIDGRLVADVAGPLLSYVWSASPPRVNGKRKTASVTTSSIVATAQDAAGNAATAAVTVTRQ
ncbi:MAG: S8 family serine peptidase [Burkholderiales bacterium]